MEKTQRQTTRQTTRQTKLVHHLEPESLEFNDYAIADDRFIVRKTGAIPVRINGVRLVADLTTIDDKLAKKITGIVRQLTSDKPGEAAAATEAFGRTLQSAGVDIIHAVAERIEHSGGLSDAEMQEIFDGGAAK